MSILNQFGIKKKVPLYFFLFEMESKLQPGTRVVESKFAFYVTLRGSRISSVLFSPRNGIKTVYWRPGLSVRYTWLHTIKSEDLTPFLVVQDQNYSQVHGWLKASLHSRLSLRGSRTQFWGAGIEHGSHISLFSAWRFILFFLILIDAYLGMCTCLIFCENLIQYCFPNHLAQKKTVKKTWVFCGAPLCKKKIGSTKNS